VKLLVSLKANKRNAVKTGDEAVSLSKKFDGQNWLDLEKLRQNLGQSD